MTSPARPNTDTLTETVTDGDRSKPFGHWSTVEAALASLEGHWREVGFAAFDRVFQASMHRFDEYDALAKRTEQAEAALADSLDSLNAGNPSSALMRLRSYAAERAK